MDQHLLRIEAFVKLGEILACFCENHNMQHPENSWLARLDKGVQQAYAENAWFTPENVLHAFGEWANVLTFSKITAWLEGYKRATGASKTVALVMAGNVPLVGFHDLLCVLVTGNRAQIKLSGNDTVLLPLLTSYLIEVEPSMENAIYYVSGKLSDFDAVIATGSNNTARYFEYYFSKKPHIIRKNRNSVAVLNGSEKPGQLSALGKDIFTYFGLGCRSVSKLFVPMEYSFEPFFEGIFSYAQIIHHHKYANNYDYNKAVYLMSDFKILDNGFLILKEDSGYASPIASLYYETYSSTSQISSRLKSDAPLLQCVVASGVLQNEVDFGETQSPRLKDYADGVDTIEFLTQSI